MTDLATLLAAPALESTTFVTTSRYYGSPLRITKTQDGEEVVYVSRRFPPQLEDMEVQSRVVIAEGERLDLISASHFSDPTQWWRIADSNLSMDIDDLTAEVGKEINIATPKVKIGV